jgi:hypothetical protein
MASSITARLATLAAGALLALPVVALADSANSIKPKTTYVYTSYTKSGKGVGFSVAKHGKGYRLVDFGISCVVNAGNVGGYLIPEAKEPTISPSGKFSYKGKVRVSKDDQFVPGSATLNLSGRFLSSTKVKLTAVISHPKPALKDCPGKSFTVRWTQ